MIRNLLLHALRTIGRDRLYALINTSGLAIGMTSCMLLYVWIARESSYDSYLTDADRIYRVVTTWEQSSEKGMATTYPMVKGLILDQMPEIEASTRLHKADLLSAPQTLSTKEKIFANNDIYYGDSSFFDVFPFRIVHGDQKTPLQKPNAVVLTVSTAEKYFGTADPVGQILLLGEEKELEVTAVVEDIPTHSHFRFDALVTMQAHPWIRQAEESIWSGIVFYSYVKLKAGATPDTCAKALTRMIQHLPADTKGFGKNTKLELQPIPSIHLHSHLQLEASANGDIRYLYIFGSVGLIILVLACVNYVNLATARFSKRLKESSVRQMLGANRAQVLSGFLVESVMMALLAGLIAIGLFELVTPFILQYTGQSHMYVPSGPGTWLIFISAAAAIGLLAGAIPAVLLSSPSVRNGFRQSAGPLSHGVALRKGLLGFQFLISILLTTCTLIGYQQMKMISQQKFGIEKDNVLILRMGHRQLIENYHKIIPELHKLSMVANVSAASQIPVNILEAEGLDILGSGRRMEVSYLGADRHLFSTLKLDILAGAQRIDAVKDLDTVNQYVINETAMRQLGWTPEEALDQSVILRHGDMRPGKVIGVVRDFHYQSAHQPVGPLVMEMRPWEYQYLLVKVDGTSEKAIEQITNVWNQVVGQYPLQYSFLDQEYENLYRAEYKSMSLILLFAALAVTLAVLGLFGLTAYAVERRIKEIGIRKVLGAQTGNLIGLLTREYVWIMIVSFSLAAPASYLIMEEWLGSFSYRVTQGPAEMMTGGAINMLMILITISYHAIVASRINPSKTLRTE